VVEDVSKTVSKLEYAFLMRVMEYGVITIMQTIMQNKARRHCNMIVVVLNKNIVVFVFT